MTFASHRGEVLTREGQNHAGLQGDGIARGTDQPRVREQARDVPSLPLHRFAPPGSTVDENADVSGQQDVEALHGRALRGQHVPLVEMPNDPM
jgi:hypothetical protein